MAQRLLEGQIEDEAVADDRDVALGEATNEIRALRRELAEVNERAFRERRESARAIAELRRQLTPLYRALQGVFGEMDAAGVESAPEPPGASAPSSVATRDPRVTAVWESWKSRLGGAAAKIIDALLLHGEMNTMQLSVVCQCRRQTVSDNIMRLNKANLIDKNGGRFSLKKLA